MSLSLSAEPNTATADNPIGLATLRFESPNKFLIQKEKPADESNSVAETLLLENKDSRINAITCLLFVKPYDTYWGGAKR